MWHDRASRLASRQPGRQDRALAHAGPAGHYDPAVPVILEKQPVELQGVTVRITSPERTVIDCFRYRNKIGIDVALEALKDVLHHQRTTVDAIMCAAEVGRVSTVIKPYLEAMLA